MTLPVSIGWGARPLSCREYQLCGQSAGKIQRKFKNLHSQDWGRIRFGKSIWPLKYPTLGLHEIIYRMKRRHLLKISKRTSSKAEEQFYLFRPLLDVSLELRWKLLTEHFSILYRTRQPNYLCCQKKFVSYGASRMNRSSFVTWKLGVFQVTMICWCNDDV